MDVVSDVVGSLDGRNFVLQPGADQMGSKARLLERPEVRDARRTFLVLAHNSWDTRERWPELLDTRRPRTGERLFPKLWGIRVLEWGR